MSDFESAANRRTAVKTFRFSEDLLRALEKEAEKEGTTLNGLVSSVLIKHAEWGQMEEKLGIVPVTKALLLAALESTNQAELEIAARERIPAAWRDMCMLRYNAFNLETLLQLFQDATNHSPNPRMSLKKEGNHYTLTFAHSFGYKYSLLFGNGLDEVLQGNLHIKPNIRYEDSLISCDFTLPGLLPPQEADDPRYNQGRAPDPN